MQTIGFIGLGIMGKPMALNLIQAGFEVSVFARRLEVSVPLSKAGAKVFDSPKALASHCEVIITMVPATTDVEETLLGINGIIHTAKPRTIVIDMSTISASATRQIAQTLYEKNIHMLDAPVSGGEQGAKDGSLSIMVGGKAETLEKVRNILEVLGKNIIRIGDHGAGQIAKSCNQIIVAETILAVSEALALAKAAGVDPVKVREALLGGFASSRILELHGNRMIEKNYTPGFKTSLHKKDINLALDQASQFHLKLPAAEYALKCLEEISMQGHSELDSSAMHLLFEK